MRSLPFLFLLLLVACQSSEKLSLNPELGKTYEYELSSEALRTVGETEESVQNILKFGLEFVNAEADIYNTHITFSEISMLTEGEEDVFGGFGDLLRDSLLNNPIPYLINKQGGIKYPYNDSISYMEKVNALSMIDDEALYQTEMVQLMTNELRNGLFVEWIDYLPANPTKGKKWKTSHTMSFMNIIEKEQEYEWQIVSSDDQSVEIKGMSTIESLNGKVEIGMGVMLNIEFKGAITSTYELTIEKSSGLIEEGKLSIITDGSFTRTAEGTPIAEQMEPEVESLKGNSTTTIKRL